MMAIRDIAKRTTGVASAAPAPRLKLLPQDGDDTSPTTITVRIVEPKEGN